jgi:Cu2+-containing amine oxidase
LPPLPKHVNGGSKDTQSTNKYGQRRSYEIEVPQLAGRDQYSTGDVWVTTFRGNDVQQGGEVGKTCSDKELETLYAVGALNPAAGGGNDIVLWVAVHVHHEPRDQGEEHASLPGFHYAGLSILPRNFWVSEI